MKRFAMLGAIMILVFALQSAAIAGQVTLHPSGFGEHSYSAWKAHEGLPDDTGSKNQALYLQKMTSTATFAAGVAVFKGFEGMPTSAISPLGFWYRTDGHCGAGAPRFNVRIEVSPGVRQTFFFGCNSGMVPGGVQVDDEGRVWNERTTVGLLPPGTVVSLAIVFDEGNDVGLGYVYLDNIQVGPHAWTSASDNGNGQTIESAGTGTATVEALLGEPVTVLFPD